MASKLQPEYGWKRVGYGGTYFSIQCVGRCTSPKGGNYSQLRLFTQPIGRGRGKCFFTVQTSDWDAFVDLLEDGKKKGDVRVLRALAGRGEISIGVINRNTRAVIISIKPSPNTSGAEGVVIGEVR